VGYDPENIFAKILRGDIPSYKVLETEHCFVLLDAFPVARFHCLLLPKVAR
jgi:histidine triad (HIT) family protein